MEIKEMANHKTKFIIQKFWAKDGKEVDKKGLKPFETVEFDMNILVNGGINALLTLFAGGGGDAFNNANSYTGVGDSTDAAAAAQTDLQAASNKVRVAMNVSFPTFGTDQKIVFQSDFGSAVANFDWEEFAIFNAAAAGTMFNRKVSSQGTKVAGQTWRLQTEITIS
jgi:hypothetical protein